MTDEQTYAVTLVRAGSGLPSFEVGAYRYTGRWLPSVGDVVTVSKIAGAEPDEQRELTAYVTRVDPMSDTPIRVMLATDAGPASYDDDIIAA